MLDERSTPRETLTRYAIMDRITGVGDETRGRCDVRWQSLCKWRPTLFSRENTAGLMILSRDVYVDMTEAAMVVVVGNDDLRL